MHFPLLYISSIFFFFYFISYVSIRIVLLEIHITAVLHSISYYYILDFASQCLKTPSAYPLNRYPYLWLSYSLP